MGNKVHPKAFRLGVTTTWSSKWFAGRDFKKNLEQDVTVRAFLLKDLREAQVSEVMIERKAKGINVIIRTAKPGLVIGRSGVGAEDLKKKIMNKFFRGRRVQLSISVEEISKPALSAPVVAQQIIADIEKRMPYRRSMKGAIERAFKAGALGVKVRVSGRLNGAEIARREQLVSGKIPLHNLRADIDYCQDFAQTMMGTIGVKVWIYRGEVFGKAEGHSTETKPVRAEVAAPAKA
ncbi:MAG: 30S ribosomal protein S3 [bacterium]